MKLTKKGYKERLIDKRIEKDLRIIGSTGRSTN